MICVDVNVDGVCSRIATLQACLGAAFQQRWHPAAFKALFDTQSWLRRHITIRYQDTIDTISNYRNIMAPQ